MNVDKSTYDLFSKAIYYAMKKEGATTFAQLTEGAQDCFKQQKAKVDGLVGLVRVAVKHDIQANNVIEVVTEKGKNTLVRKEKVNK
ncbi:MAG TPA: hypothetical protein VEY10_20360 [Flavisolibacter sp.]|nr:hypothetical protein [Flavisolibacter sp.]